MSLRPLSWYKALRTSAGRTDAGAFLLEGTRAIELVSIAHRDQLIEIIAREKERGLEKFKCPVRVVSEKQLRAICPAQNPSGVCALVMLPKEKVSGGLPENPGEKILLLEEVQDPGNVGTLIRTAAAFGFRGAILSPGTADPFGPKAVAASAGSILSLWIRRTEHYMERLDQLKTRGFSLVAADLEGNDFFVPNPAGKVICALGNEGNGLTWPLLDKADIRLKIPIEKTRAESLNVAVCGGIAMFLLSRRRASG
jgi:TrmH family RNA methyltransferase